MSATTLICWQTGHGLCLETRAGIHEVLAQRNGSTRRLVNACHVDDWPDNSRTAKRLEALFQKYRGRLEELNERSFDTDPAIYRSLYWKLKGELKGE